MLATLTPVIERAATARPDQERILLEGPHSRFRELRLVLRVAREFISGFRTLHFVGPCVTVFGSARFQEGHHYYALGRAVGGALARLSFTVMTGGGPGLMEAANRGAREEGGNVSRLQYRVTAGAEAESVPGSMGSVPLLLRT